MTILNCSLILCCLEFLLESKTKQRSICHLFLVSLFSYSQLIPESWCSNFKYYAETSFICLINGSMINAYLPFILKITIFTNIGAAPIMCCVFVWLLFGLIFFLCLRAYNVHHLSYDFQNVYKIFLSNFM